MATSVSPIRPALKGAFACECGDGLCSVLVQASLEEYRLAAARPGRFLVAPGHNGFSGPSNVFAESARYAIIELAGRRRGAAVPLRQR
jgi:hypothetical protein